MMRISVNTSAVIVLAVVLAGCASAQKPVQFAVQADGAEALGTIRSALAEQGLETASVDEGAGIIYTTWMDTGFMYGEVQDTTATIVRRYVVVLTPAAAGSNLVLRADTKRCAQDGYEIDGIMVTGACEQMSNLVGPHQQELDALGGHLRSRVQ